MRNGTSLGTNFDCFLVDNYQNCGKKWELVGAKSGEYGECPNASVSNSCKVEMVCLTVCERILKLVLLCRCSGEDPLKSRGCFSTILLTSSTVFHNTAEPDLRKLY